ncbi:MAG: hypothetical protein H8E55_74375 [Pelagibacterales bacterium]|nr:hypothetical protein [Pelagibacterales bacterium]
MRWIVIILLGVLLYYSLSIFASSVGLAEENDTAFTTNILPNAGTTTSSLTNSTLDGVQSGSTGALTNNSTHNGFTITCDTQVNNACGNAFNGELEASHDMTVKATGSLVGIEGDSTPDGVTHTSTQIKLNGGINLSSSISVQNCEWSGSAYQCGNSVGVVDSYTITMKVLDADENVLASSTQIRTTDSGYNLNARSFNDSLHYNGVHANKYEWSWTGVDGSESTSSALRGPNLLGAEMALDFPTDDYEPLSTTEIATINEALGTANLNESQIWDVVSGLEESIGETLNIETGGAVTSVEFNEETFEVIVYTAPGASVEEVAKVQELVQTMTETKTVETLKTEVIKEVIEEAKQEVTSGPQPMLLEEAPKKEESGPTEHGPMKMASTTKEEKQTVKEAPSVIEEKNEKEENTEPKEKESPSEATATSVVSKQNNTKQKKIQSKETAKPELKVMMAKIDAKVKNPLKNLQLKNLIKMDAMVEDQLSLDAYNVAFYEPKDIYLEQLNLIDNRLIYANVSLATYVDNDKMIIKARKLGEINSRKQKLLIELETLKNG